MAVYHLITARKYTILIDLPILLISLIPRLLLTMIYDDEVGLSGVMIASPAMCLTAIKAFEYHGSQVKWKRYKHVLCLTSS